MTAATLRTLWRSLVNEQDSTRVADATVDFHFQSALEAMNRRVRYRFKLDGSITITATTDFALPTDCIDVLVVEWNGNPLRKGSIKEWRKKGSTQDWRSKTGTPEEYALIGRRMYLYPAPNAAAVDQDNSLLVQYLQASGTFADAELAFLCDNDHRILAYFAAAEWVRNPANSFLGSTYANDLQTVFETECKAVADQYMSRDLQP